MGFKTQPNETGRPAYHPTTMLKLFVYGYLNRVHSSRRLEREARMLKAPGQQISLTDPDARSMKSRGAGVVGYNVQTAVSRPTCPSHRHQATRPRGSSAVMPSTTSSRTMSMNVRLAYVWCDTSQNRTKVERYIVTGLPNVGYALSRPNVLQVFIAI